ncbi:hypothetical protein [Cytobacillus praedii]|uniref:VCBS repeat-containing protein n=1 Tax=Cytobacillus praedii TaxID=1742358 RepID=A0A4R1AQY9_9BACI|nr:hypothetical protein [Cytobacillus praedii]TCJ02452.1 hypothetical protein E0Y62_19140 [Cytobacillus praedii]
MASPTFHPAAVYPIGVSHVHNAAADLNNDGSIDLAIVNIGSNDVTILLNTGAVYLLKHQESPIRSVILQLPLPQLI